MEFNLLQNRRGAVSLDATAHAPRLDDERVSAGRRTADRARELNVAVETRHATLDPDREIGFGGEWLVDWIDHETQLGPGVVADAAARDAIRITLPGNDEGAIAFDRPHERTQFASEIEFLEHEPAVARGIGEGRARILDLQARDRHRFQVEAELGKRPGKAAGGIEPGRELGPLEPGIGNAPFTPRERTQCEFDAQ